MQNRPLQNNHPPVYLQVADDIVRRAHDGKESYGTFLQPNNGRDSLQDAYDEALDLAKYLKTKIEEEKIDERHWKAFLIVCEIYQVSGCSEWGLTPNLISHVRELFEPVVSKPELFWNDPQKEYDNATKTPQN